METIMWFFLYTFWEFVYPPTGWGVLMRIPWRKRYRVTDSVEPGALCDESAHSLDTVGHFKGYIWLYRALSRDT